MDNNGDKTGLIRLRGNFGDKKGPVSLQKIVDQSLPMIKS